MKQSLKIALAAASTMLIAACASQDPQINPNNYGGSHPVQRTMAMGMDTIVFIDHELNRTDIRKSFTGDQLIDTVKLTVESSGVRRSATGTLEVWAVLRNRTDYDLQAEGKTQFYDNGQAPLTDQSAWKRVYIPANGTSVYRESSLNQLAEHFIVEVREGR